MLKIIHSTITKSMALVLFITAALVAWVLIGVSQLHEQLANAQLIPGIEPGPIKSPNPLAPRNQTCDPTSLIAGKPNSTSLPLQFNSTAIPGC